ncbi:MAG TPA: ABC transporter permease [Gemmatimonadales bacterium]|nr:ABC transporter permease [Gemmatimonadales bacterium]
MTSVSSGAPPAAWARGGGLMAFIAQTLAVAEMEARKLLRDPTELVSRAVQPVLWLIVFGQVFTRTHAIPTGAMSYLEFMAPGVLAQGVLFTAIFYGIAVIWERDLGIVHKLLVSPAPRASLVLGKALAAGARGLPQAGIIFLLAALLGLRLEMRIGALITLIVLVVLGSATFATFSLVVACAVKTRERFMGIGQLLTMPLFFASNAIYPLELMPPWLRAVARVNPLTYLVDGLRATMIHGATSRFGLAVDVAVPALLLAALVAIAARLYPGLAR